MDADPPELGPALLEWANAIGPPNRIIKWEDFRDGALLWDILQNVDKDYFAGSLPEETPPPNDNWISRWQNLKHIDRMVMKYIRDECGKLPELSNQMTPDLQAIAISGSQEHLVKVLSQVCGWPYSAQMLRLRAVIEERSAGCYVLAGR